MRDTHIHYEATSNLFIVHFDNERTRFTERYWADDSHDMEKMGREVKSFHDLDLPTFNSKVETA